MSRAADVDLHSDGVSMCDFITSLRCKPGADVGTPRRQRRRDSRQPIHFGGERQEECAPRRAFGLRPDAFPARTRLRPRQSVLPHHRLCADSSAQDRADLSSAGSTLRCRAKRKKDPRATETGEPTGNGLGSPNQSACLYANPRKDRAKWRGNAALSNELGG